MGASQSKNEDASLQLAVPKHTKIGGRRLLEGSKCLECNRRFGVFQTKHYCRRCGKVTCEPCTIMRHYKGRNLKGFRLCLSCNAKKSLFDRLPNAVWQSIVSFAGDSAQHNVLQLSRKMQLSIPLDFPYGHDWDSFFGNSIFLSKGAHGSVYKTFMNQQAAAIPPPQLDLVAEHEESVVAALAGREQPPSMPKSPMSNPNTFNESANNHFHSPSVKVESNPSSLPQLHHTPCAVKVINKSSIFSLRKWRHIQREIDTLILCRHPHVVDLLAVFQSPEAVFMVLEFAPGGDLFDWLIRRRPLEREVQHVAVQLMVTLVYLHEVCGVVHRDIKPENILLKDKPLPGQPPHIKLADFGFARRISDRPDPRTAKALAELSAGYVKIASQPQQQRFAFELKATPCGTLGFAPPEVLNAYNEHKAHPEAAPAAPQTDIEIMKKTDIFAAAVTICVLLTGKEPFPCHSSAAHIAAVQAGLDTSGRHWQHVSSQAKSILKQMLHSDPIRRPSALEVVMSPWLNGQSVPTALPSHLSASGASLDAQLDEYSAKKNRSSSGTHDDDDDVPLEHRAGGVVENESQFLFKESVKSLKKRPDMVYVQGPDGAMGRVTKEVIAAKEEADDDHKHHVLPPPKSARGTGGSRMPTAIVSGKSFGSAAVIDSSASLPDQCGSSTTNSRRRVDTGEAARPVTARAPGSTTTQQRSQRSAAVSFQAAVSSSPPPPNDHAEDEDDTAFRPSHASSNNGDEHDIDEV